MLIGQNRAAWNISTVEKRPSHSATIDRVLIPTHTLLLIGQNMKRAERTYSIKASVASTV
jgi:hypothetical protein